MHLIKKNSVLNHDINTMSMRVIKHYCNNGQHCYDVLICLTDILDRCTSRIHSFYVTYIAILVKN
jgi:hypothetical protein